MEQKKLRDAARLSLGKSRQLRKVILEKVEELKNGHGDLQKIKNATLTARLEEIDDLLKQLRLYCMEVIFYDFEYAHEKETEGTLWQMHVALNTEYRRVVAHVNTQNQVVLKRKVDKLYRDFLKTSQFFYRGYIQRLSGQFHIPELQQVAQGLQVDPFVAAQQSPPPSTALRTKLVSSCYLTLVRMGDLARYRCQHTEKASKTSLEIALTYYGLAQMLDPDDGASYHQTAVLYQPSAKQLEIVYYFLRSVCVAKPHKLGAANLERALKGVLSSQPGSKAISKNVAVKDPNEALTSWFLKLHANYFQGAKFSAQTELEKEVLHRFEVCLKVKGNEALALMMTLANIAACDFAFDNIKEPTDWTIERSQSCQFTLSFQVSVAVVILRVFRSIVQDDVASGNNLNQGVNNSTSKAAIEFSTSFNRLLPLVRILFGWIYVSRGQLAQYQDWLEPTIKDLHSLSADILSLLLPLAISNIDTIESQYLLPEDVEALGLKPYSDRKLPLFFDVQIIPGCNPPKCRKTLKPRKDFVSGDSSARVEDIWRIRDIICCGIYLSGSSSSPLSIMTSAENTDAWVYLKDGPLKDIDQVSMARMLSQVKMTAQKVAAVTSDQAVLDDGGLKSPTPAIEPQQPSAMTNLSNPDSNLTSQQSRLLGRPLGQTTKLSFDDEMSADPNMAGMVDKLLDEEEDDLCPHSGNSRKDTTYGMDSSVANDVFNNIVPSPVSKAPTANVPIASNGKAIPNLPWNYFYSPSPTEETDANRSLSSGLDIPRIVANQGGLSTGSIGQSPIFTNHMQTLSPKEGPFSMYGVQRAPQPAQGPASLHSRTPSDANSPSYSAVQRAAALDNLKSALFAEYGTGASGSPSPSYPYEHAPVNQNEGSRSSLGHRTRSSVSSPLANLQDSPDSLEQTRDPLSQGIQGLQVGRYPGGGAIRSPLGRTAAKRDEAHFQHASPFTAGLGFINPPTQELAHHGSAGSPNLGNMTFAQQFPAMGGSPSSLAFSDPSSLWTGTPGAPIAPRGTVACNGNFFNASTPFGRAGHINNRDDPTHFRNRLQELGTGVGETIAAYDRAILESAMANITNNQRSQQ